MNNDKHVCCICGKEFEGYPRNPYPVKETGVCCKECDNSYVITARLMLSFGKKKEEPVCSM